MYKITEDNVVTFVSTMVPVGREEQINYAKKLYNDFTTFCRALMDIEDRVITTIHMSNLFYDINAERLDPFILTYANDKVLKWVGIETIDNVEENIFIVLEIVPYDQYDFVHEMLQIFNKFNTLERESSLGANANNLILRKDNV